MLRSKQHRIHGFKIYIYERVYETNTKYKTQIYLSNNGVLFANAGSIWYIIHLWILLNINGGWGGGV
jgi:hypothetical protein